MLPNMQQYLQDPCQTLMLTLNKGILLRIFNNKAVQGLEFFFFLFFTKVNRFKNLNKNMLSVNILKGCR